MPKFSIDLEARIAKFQDSLDQVGKNTERLTGRIERSFKKISSGISFLGVGFGAAAFIGQIRAAADELDQLGKRAEKTGASVEGLQRVQFGLNLNANFNDEQVDRILTNIARKFKEAESASSGAAKSFQRLGIDPKKYTDTTDALIDITEALAKIPPGADRTGLAMQALGEELGPRALPAVGTLRSMGDEADRLGLIMDERASKAAARFNDNLSRVAATTSAIATKFFTPLVVVLADLGDAFRRARIAGKGFFESLSVTTLPNEVSNLSDQYFRLTRQIDEAEKNLNRDGISERLEGVYTRRLERAKTQRAEVEKELDRAKNLLNEYFPPATSNSYTAPTFGPLDGAAGKGSSDLNEKLTAGERYIDNLKRQAEALRDLTEVEQLQADVAAGRVDFAAGEQQRAQAIAAQIDAERANTRAIEEKQQRFEEFLSQQQRERELLEQSAEGYRLLANPVQEYLDKLVQISKLQGLGLLTTEEAEKNASLIYDQIAAMSNLQDKTDDVQDSFQSLNDRAQDALADAVFEADNLGDALRRLLVEFAKLEFKKSILGPLFNGATSLFSGGAAADLAGSSGEAGLIGLDSLPAVSLAAPSAFGGGAKTVINEYKTYNIPADVSISSVEAAVARGSRATELKVIDSRRRGGVFA